MRRASDSSIEAFCEEALLTNGQRCARPASITITRFGETFSVCAECAMRDYLRHHRNGAEATTPSLSPAASAVAGQTVTGPRRSLQSR
jgi:hypothetical protein